MTTEQRIPERRYDGHTPGPWEWAAGPRTREQFLAYCAQSWDRADGNLEEMHVVQCDDANGENLTVAILGNGPTAHINGPLIAAAPDILRERNELLGALRELRDECAEIPCLCHEAFTERNLRDPDCPKCNWQPDLATADTVLAHYEEHPHV